MSEKEVVNRMLASRRENLFKEGVQSAKRKRTSKGGCGVIGIASSEQIAGRHLLQSLIQMRNRGNGKGGGVAAVGLRAEEFGVSRKMLEGDYLLVIAYLNPSVRADVERTAIRPTFRIDHIHEMEHSPELPGPEGLEVIPPKVVCYFSRVKPQVVELFQSQHGMEHATRRQIQDEIVYQNSYKLNTRYYASTGESDAFVLSHGKNMLVLKMVGFGDDVVRYYHLEDVHAHVWIGHHRYPTKGRVWHPGGAHPFVGLNEALVHNGDFANYSSITEYLAQRHIHPLYLTDTEVSVLVFDLLHRMYDYPLEYVIEALAPTTERDFTQLPNEKQDIYRMLQTTHMHCSPDGPWFFLIAQSAPDGLNAGAYRLIGITDTSMLRPQVFALQDHGDEGPSIGFAASEKQGIDAALLSLSEEDPRFWPRADRYWNARGGSHTDGGAFIFSVEPGGDEPHLVCTDKFGREIEVPSTNPPLRKAGVSRNTNIPPAELPDLEASGLEAWFIDQIPTWTYQDLESHLRALVREATTDRNRSRVFSVLTHLIDRRYPLGHLRRSCVLSMSDRALENLVKRVCRNPSDRYNFAAAGLPMPDPTAPGQKVVVDARKYEPQGEASISSALVDLAGRGFRHFIVVNLRGHRFLGNGFGEGTSSVRIEVYGSSGDYLASGIDGMQINVHGSAQDQLAQIMKSGTLVVHGDVGQTFGYAAKGGEAYILGNAAGRPMINAVGSPRVVINGTCLDYLAESFMAGDPHDGGGFVILNGIRLSDEGQIIDLDEPYPGGNLFSLASGGAIYVRDPLHKLSENQLNGGEFAPLTEKDWHLIEPYLRENERHFEHPVARLLRGKDPAHVYRKIRPRAVRALQAEEAWVSGQD